MLHSIKLQLSNADTAKLLSCDARLSETDARLRALLRTFPTVQKCIEENEKSWGMLAYSLRATGAAYRDALCGDAVAAPACNDTQDSDSPLCDAVDALCRAGERQPSPRLLRGHESLRGLNARARTLRAHQAAAVRALRNRVYYARKVATLAAAGDRNAAQRERRARNAQKLAEATADVDMRTDKLEVELKKVLARRHDVLASSMRAFVELQLRCLSGEEVSPVLAMIPVVETAAIDSLLACASSLESTSGTPNSRNVGASVSASRQVLDEQESEWFATPELTPDSSVASKEYDMLD